MTAAEIPRLQVQGAPELKAGGRVLVRGLQLEVQGGQCWALIGSNGSGKSTLLRALAGFDRGWRKHVLVDGRPLSGLDGRDLARRRALLAQERSDVFGMSALQAVVLARHVHAGAAMWEGAADMDAALDALLRFDCLHLQHQDVRTLSGGERQRVALAALWAQDCDLMLLDEPGNHLDLPHLMRLTEVLHTACLAGRSALVVVHDLNLVARFATHVLLLLPDGGWRAGPRAEVMTAKNLQASLSYPLYSIEHQGQSLWLPGSP